MNQAGFYETLIARRGAQPLLLAWTASGKDAGQRAAFAREGEGLCCVYRDDAFPEWAAALAEGTKGAETGLASCGEGEVFLEWTGLERRIVICGAGHVSMPLIRIARLLSYDVTVIDDREEFAGRAREAGAARVICRPFEAALDELEEDGTMAFVVMTRAHAHDQVCLRKILGRSFAYAGMMGSRRRSALIREQLLEEGFDRERVEKIHMPVGVPIGARTPGEIAVSVMAEIVQEMNRIDQGELWPEGMMEELARAEDGNADQAGAGGAGTRAKNAGVLAVIVEKEGEAPRRPGTRMLIRADGSFLGTVGGGLAEARILEAGREILRRPEEKAQLITVGLQKGSMQCGGRIRVLLLRL